MWDSEAMRNPGGYVPAGPPFMGSESVAFMHHSMKEAKRLAGDLDLPAEKKFTRTNITFNGYRGKPGTWQVQPAGLLGPVRLLPSVDVKVDIDGRGNYEKG